MRSLNRVELIGNLTRDPEVKATETGKLMAKIVVATDRAWKTETGEQKTEAEFHKVIAFDKLADLMGVLLKKGTRVYIEGRIKTRVIEKGEEKIYVTEIIANDMIVL